MGLAGGGGRPAGRLARAAMNKKRQQTLNNVKLTLLCGFITVLVLRGTVGFNLLVSGGVSDEASDAKVVEDIERMLQEIRSDSELEDDAGVVVFGNSTTASSSSSNNSNNDTSSSSTTPTPRAPERYSLGPRVNDWDATRQTWMSRNPEFPSRDAQGKPKILLVTGSPPGPCDNPMGDHYLLKAIKNKIDYCRLHGIEILYNTAHLDPELTGYWSKIPLARRLMLAHPEVEWIWWVDSDAIFTDMAFELPLSRYEGKNLVIHGYPDLLEKRSWISLNAGIFLLRNCQWSLDLLDAWVQVGPKGPVRVEAGKMLTASLTGRPAFDADDQSALIHMLLTEKDTWMDRVHVETEFYLHGFWTGLVDKYEEMMEKHHPGLGDDRWPFITHFVGCKTCGRYEDYPLDRCLSSMERAVNFADNQVLRLYGFQHRSLTSPKVRRVTNRSENPLEAKEAALKLDARFESP